MSKSNLIEERKMEVVRALGRAGKLHRCCIDAEVEKLGFDLRRHQHIMLIYLESTDGAASQKDIAEAFGISAAAVANTLKSLEKEGYICRVNDGEDTRKKTVALTPKGIAVITKTKDTLCGIDQKVTEGLPDDKLEILLECIDLMEKNLKKMLEEFDLED